MRILMLAFAFEQQYHVLRAAKAAGHSVCVLGRDTALGLKYSNACSAFREMKFDPAKDPLQKGVDEIKFWIRQLNGDLVIPSDVVSTRLLAAIGDQLPVPTNALPSPETFDMTNDKWSFHQFCEKNGIASPDTRLLADKSALKAALADGSLKLPIIIKPLDSMSGRGIHPIRDQADLRLLDTVDYKPILVQNFIAGECIDVSILANHGKVIAYAIQRNIPGRYEFIKHDSLLKEAQHFAEACNFHGIAHLDGIQDEKTGKIFLLECNPRFWYSVYAAAVAGLNFVALSFDRSALESQHTKALTSKTVLKEKALFKKMLSLRMNDMDRKVLAYYLADPVGKLCGRLPKFDDEAVRAGGSIEDQVEALAAMRRARQSETGRGPASASAA